MKKIIALLLVATVVFSFAGCALLDYPKAQKLFEDGDYEEARDAFEELDDYKDSQKMVKACDYEIAEDLMKEEKYDEAAELFEELDDYEDSSEKAAECLLLALEKGLKGKWKNESLSYMGIETAFEFEDGRITAHLSINGESSVANAGDYRIAPEEKIVYITYDNIIDVDGATKNYEEKPLFVFTYEDGVFTLISESDGQTLVKE